MKKILLILFFNCGLVFTYAQSVFDKFENNEKVNTTIVNKKMFELMAKVKVDANAANSKNYLALIKKLDNLKVFTTSDTGVSKNLVSAVNTYLTQYPMSELMRSSENGKSVKIFAKSANGSEIIQEMLMLIEDQNTNNQVTVMSLSGNFLLSELTVLTEKLNLPGTEAIQKAVKK